MANSLTNIKAILTLNTKQFQQATNDTKKRVKGLQRSFVALGSAIGLAFSTKAIIDFNKELATLYVDAKNAGNAFERLGGSNGYMNKLRDATGGTVGELKLMQQTIQAVNLNLNAADLPKFFEFATIRAAETGVAVDYLVQSIVTGVGRQSRLVLDNLGISLRELNAEIARTGDFTSAAFNLIERAIEESDVDVNDLVGGFMQLGAAIENLKLHIANSGLGEWLDTHAKAFSAWVKEIYGDYKGFVAVVKESGKILEKSLTFATDENLQKVLTDMTAEYNELLAERKEIVDAGGPAMQNDLNMIQDMIKLQIHNIRLLKEEIQTRKEAVLVKPRPTEVEGGSGKAKDRRNFDVPGVIDRYKDQIEGLKLLQLRLTVTGEDAAETARQIQILKDAIEALEDPLKVAQKTFADSVIVLDEFKEDLVDITETLGYVISDIAAYAIQGAMDVLADALEGRNVLESFGNFLSQLGRMMMSYGALMAAKGVLEQVAKTGGPQGIAAGIALIGVGAAAVAVGGSIGRATSPGAGFNGASIGNVGGSYSGGSYGSFGSNYDNNREVVLVARGDDLVATINRANFRYGENG